MAIEVNAETRGFQSEVTQLLDLMIHSLYSNKEIFLRELVSNAADALDKLRFAALSSDGLYEGDPDLKIEVDFSDAQKTITIRDNGIGMSREEVIDHIGTIAKSGTAEFFNALTGDSQKDTQLIGQFGVGFYSAFIVAEKVTLTTRKAGASEDEGVRWESEGGGEYTVQTLKRKARGTEIVLALREDASEFVNDYRLRAIIRKYSDHISWPINMPKQGEEETGTETVNSATALWTRSRKDISDEEYEEFYKHVAHDFEAPLARTHNKVEGKLEYSTLLFIPSKAPFDLWDQQSKHGVKLYVRRVFIMDDAEQLVPRYLRFVRGIVDTDDLPLNVSREILQQNKTIDSIRGATSKRVLGMLEDLVKNQPENYEKFWGEFGKVLKEGIVEDAENSERIAKLLRFSSTKVETEKNEVALEQYVERMQEGQKAIYYLIAENFVTAKASPHLEIFRARDIEVLLLTDPIDEWLTTHLNEFDGKPLKSVSRGELDLDATDGDEEAQGKSEQTADDAQTVELVGRVKAALGDAVKDVRTTQRLTTSPACLVADESDMGANLQRILKAAGQDVPDMQPILEINATHPMVERLRAQQEGRPFDDWAHLLFEQALLSEGGRLEDPAAFVQRLNQVLLDLSA